MEILFGVLWRLILAGGIVFVYSFISVKLVSDLFGVNSFIFHLMVPINTVIGGLIGLGIVYMFPMNIE